MSETNRRRLYELLKIPENNVCADCDDKGQLIEFICIDFIVADPLWASTTFGVFLCTTCASIHRQLTVSISRVKSLKLDNWDQCHVVTMEENGNKAAKALYEKCVPPYYRRPKHDDVQVLKEQWIRAKYERKEFMESVKTCYSEPIIEITLMKRGKKDGKFYPRLFILSKNEGNLKYFINENKKGPKAVINIEHLNATFCPVKVQNPNGLQLTYQKDGFTRSIFVYTEKGKRN
ncbi:arf-GAP with dual PH domain-containing 2-like protein [Leptotrombidium deliense]|uniref:Arf-GAP with dual PH domain-containing 2-like protein n=1 Tax=Leptotrombidium deliense TaxID=299467 RepID=A0A443SCQ3_9ACAR|nr:arf-GAP with dual PH domain-containing 2-like protein [Leptotrombidium deliense]